MSWFWQKRQARLQLPKKMVPAVLGNPSALHEGDDAFVVGNPFGLYSSMSAGVISGFGRAFQPPGGKPEIKGLIQIDAAVNPGNSGGPLLNRAGEVVGIVTGIVNPTDQNVFIGIGFAVPINIAGSALGAPQY
jgi:S1-C subfamily serine protease